MKRLNLRPLFILSSFLLLPTASSWSHVPPSVPETSRLLTSEGATSRGQISRIAQAVSLPPERTDRPATNSPSETPKLTGLPGEIDRIAEQITVRIDSENSGNGSGVIIARNGQTYYIVTAFHVVENQDEYTVITPEGKKHLIKPNDIVKENGLDVAILKFTSQQNYQIATLAQYNLSDDKEHWIFYSGFPGAAGGKRQFNPGYRFSRETGFFEAKDTVTQLSNGYELVFTNQSLPGMSGGALLDLKGRVIGIGGRQEGEDYSTKIQRYLGYAFGVPTATALGLATKAGIKAEWMKIETTPPTTLTEVQAREMLEQPAFAVPKPSEDADENYWLNYGNQLWRLRKYDEAIAGLQQAIEKNPEFYQAYYVKGLVQQSQEKYDEAVATFGQVIQLRPDYYQAWREQSGALRLLKKYPEAIAAIDKAIQFNFDQATEDNLKDFILYVNKGNILSELNRYQEAEATYTEAIKIKPSEIAYTNRGVLRYELKQYPEALADYNQALKINPQSALAYTNRGDVRTELKQYPEAIADFNQALKINPQYAGAYLGRGNVRRELKQYPEAIADFNQALKINPQYAGAYLNRGNVRRELGQYSEAIADYNQALKIAPRFTGAYFARGNVRRELGQYSEAIADYTQALAINPQYAEAYNNQGVVHKELKQYPEAIADYTQALAINPQYAGAYLNRGVVHKELKQYPEAIADYTQALAINPQYAEAYYNRGNVRRELGQYSEAIADLQIAAQLFEQQGNLPISQEARKILIQMQSSPRLLPSQAIALNREEAAGYLKRCLERYDAKDYQGAEGDCTQAITLNPNLAQAYFFRGIVYYKLQKYQPAEADFTQVIVSNPKLAQAYFLRGGTRGLLENYRGAEEDLNKASQLFLEQNDREGYRAAQEGLNILRSRSQPSP